MSSKRSTTFAFALIVSLFFMWGFAHNLDPVLIPHLKKAFTLSTTQATLVDSAVFAAYFIMAIPAGIIMKKVGYKAGIISGLLCFSLGAFLFVPAANMQSYNFFLLALFVIACGLTLLETAANPYVVALGDAESGAFRLNLAQSFNGLATALAPAVGARIILTKGYSETELAQMPEASRIAALASEASTVKLPYLVLGIALAVMALFFVFTRLPVIHSEEGSKGNVFQALRHRHLKGAVIAQFFYVGAQVCVFSLFILYATEKAGMDEVNAADYLGFCGLAFLVGRFAGTGIMKVVKPGVLLSIYAAMNSLLCVFAIYATGMYAIYAVIAICFFMSIMFPTIFALGINGLKQDTEYGSSLIIMSIVGGAILPRAFGYISDFSGNISYGFYVPLISFVIIMLFGLTGQRRGASVIK